MLDVLEPSSNTFRKCLRELRRVCGAKGILPTSHTVPSDLLGIDTDPFASGGFADVYHGTLNGLGVCIKRVQVYIGESPERTMKMGDWCHHFPRLRSFMRTLGLLSRGRHMETPGTPKCHPSPGCYYRPSPPAYFGLDVRWGTPTIHWRSRQCRSNWTGGCSTCHVDPTLTAATS